MAWHAVASGIREGLQLTASKEWAVAGNWKALKSANNLNELEGGFFPRASREECSLARIRILASGNPEQRTQSRCAQSSDMQSQQMGVVCKLLLSIYVIICHTAIKKLQTMSVVLIL